MLLSVPSKSITVALISYSLQSGWRTCASKSLGDSHKTLYLLFPKVLTEFSIMCTALVALCLCCCSMMMVCCHRWMEKMGMSAIGYDMSVTTLAGFVNAPIIEGGLIRAIING